MGNRRKPRQSRSRTRLGELADALAGQRLPGGCDDCDAYRTMQRDPRIANLTHITTHHDDTCPWFRARQR